MLHLHDQQTTAKALKKIMSSPIITIDADKSTEEAMVVLGNYKINRLPVVNEGSLIGLVTLEKITRNITDRKHLDTIS
jgi:CBS domain-containing protein